MMGVGAYDGPMPISDDQLKRLFRAYGERDDDAFDRAAETIIAGEAAANHHALAKDLRKSLQSRKRLQENKLTVLPQNRRVLEQLLTIKESKIDASKLVLNPTAEGQVQRLLYEYRKKQQLARHGFHPKNKILFWGPPGNGKTQTAFFVAYELGLPIGMVRLSALVSSYLGDTANHLQNVFDYALTNPMVLLMDEVDAIGKTRGDRNDVGEIKRVVNTFLQALDSFCPSESVLIAASNHHDVLDSALWRRFDDVINFTPPAAAERRKFLKYLLGSVKFEGSLEEISKKTSGLSYADIKRVTEEAIKTAILEDRTGVQTADITEQLNRFNSRRQSTPSKKK